MFQKCIVFMISELTKEHIDVYLKPQRMKALEKYCQNLGDLHCVMPCIPILAKLFFSHRFVGVEMPVAQQVIFLKNLFHFLKEKNLKDMLFYYIIFKDLKIYNCNFLLFSIL